MNIDHLVPSRGHSIIKVKEKPVEASGLIMAGDQSNSAPVIGTILRSSAGSQYKEGTEVIFRKYAIDELKWVNDDGVEETLFVIDHEEILAFINTNEDDYADTKSQIQERREQKAREEASSKSKEVLKENT